VPQTTIMFFGVLAGGTGHNIFRGPGRYLDPASVDGTGPR